MPEFLSEIIEVTWRNQLLQACKIFCSHKNDENLLQNATAPGKTGVAKETKYS